jgi:CheY-like chemotaxis protein
MKMEASIAKIAGRDGGSRIVVYECSPAGGESLVELLEGEGRVVECCLDAESLLDSVCTRHADAIVAVLRRECRADFGALQLVRRLAPTTPIIFVANRHHAPGRERRARAAAALLRRGAGRSQRAVGSGGIRAAARAEAQEVIARISLAPGTARRSEPEPRRNT